MRIDDLASYRRLINLHEELIDLSARSWSVSSATAFFGCSRIYQAACFGRLAAKWNVLAVRKALRGQDAKELIHWRKKRGVGAKLEVQSAARMTIP